MATLHAAIWDHCLLAARQIAGTTNSDVDPQQNATSETNATLAGLQGCDVPLIDLLQRQATQIVRVDTDGLPEAPPLISRRLDDLIEIAHARFYAYAPSDVPACWRHLYTDASILLFAARWSGYRNRRNSNGDRHRTRQHRYPEEKENLTTAELDSLIRPLDLALILAGGAGPPSRGRAWIHETLELLHWVLEGDERLAEGDDNSPKKRQRLDISDLPSLREHRGIQRHDFASGQQFNEDEGGVEENEAILVPPVHRPIPVSGPLGFEEFQEYLDRDNGRSRVPLVLKDMLKHWPAFDKKGQRLWSSPLYLKHRTLRGRRLVPVEVGRSYVDEGWSQTIVPFEEVLAPLVGWSKEKVKKDPKEQARSQTMYLAQHALFTQIPQLQADLAIPDACYTSTWMEGDDNDYNSDDDVGIPEVPVNAWLGPAGTITPLHTDPHHNLLAQVVGRKYVRLYAPEHTVALQPRGWEAGCVDMGNTSKVDVGVMEGWDVVEGGDEIEDNERKRFRDIPYVDCILEPGDTLYIPLGWWHYVRSLSVSFSVSFWWN